MTQKRKKTHTSTNPKPYFLLVYACSNCNRVLFIVEYSGRSSMRGNPKQGGPLTPRRLRAKIGDKCPYCGAPLSEKPMRIEQYPLKQLQPRLGARIGGEEEGEEDTRA